MYNLEFIEKIAEGGDVYSFYFKKPAGFHYGAGQHSLFILPGLYRPHPFTLSSAPEEDFIAFSTHVREGSRFKQRLSAMKSGEHIFMVGPLLNFTFHKQWHDYVFLAQGIGITPFRSMLIHAQQAKLPITTTLIHVDSADHSFKAITSQLATQAFYPTTPDEFRAAVAKQNKDAVYYLSGSPRFNKATKQFLREQGVPARRIRKDSFLGY